MPLTDMSCRSAKGKAKPYKLGDSGGLYLYVTPSGYRSWRWKYHFGGVEKRITFGPYPDVSLREARDLRDEAARIKRSGRDPADERKKRAAALTDEAENSFEAVARRWHARKLSTWSTGHAEQVLRTLQKDVFSATAPATSKSTAVKLWEGRFGGLPIAAITPKMVLAVVHPIEERGAVDQAHRARQRMSDVFVFALAEGTGESDPAAIVQKALLPNHFGRYPAFVKLKDARRALELTERRTGSPFTKLAARLMAVTAVRSEPLRCAAPAEFEGLDGPSPIWRIPASKMKLQLEQKSDEAFEFIVPLPRQAVEVVTVALRLAGLNSPLIFPGGRDARKPMSKSAISTMYRSVPELRGRHVPHGWRSSFSTIMNELAIERGQPENREIIDLMLAHKPSGVEAVYNRAAYMDRRRRIAQEWADMLLEGMPTAEELLLVPRY